MKRITLFFLTAVMMLTISAFTALRLKTGMSFRTDSPYDGSNCSQCHGGGSTVPTIKVSANPAFGSGNTYVAGKTYTVSVACSGSYPKYGFDIEILNSDSAVALDAGTFGPVVTPNCRIDVSPGKPTNVVHNAPSGTGNAALFSFTWTAPSGGTVYIYSACLGANNNGANTGDKVGTTSLILTQNTTGVLPIEQNLLSVNIFPNPAIDYTTINYILGENTDVNIELYDVSGKKTGVLLNENKNWGEYTQVINFSDMNLKPGVYLVVIKADDRSNIQRLVVR